MGVQKQVMDTESLKDINKRLTAEQNARDKDSEQDRKLDQITKAIFETTKASIEHRDGKQLELGKRQVRNQLKLEKALKGVSNSIKTSAEQDAASLKMLRKTLTDFQKVVKDDKVIDQDKFTDTLAGLLAISDSMTETGGKLMAATMGFSKTVDSFVGLPERLSTDLKKSLDTVTDNTEVVKAIENIEFDPQVNVNTPAIDTKPLVDALDQKLDELSVAVSVIGEKDEPLDLSPVTQGLEAVKTQIKNIIFPVPQIPIDTLKAYDTGGTLRDITAVESTATPGSWGILVLTSTGADISGGGTAADGTFDDMAGNDLDFMDGNAMAFMSG